MTVQSGFKLEQGRVMDCCERGTASLCFSIRAEFLHQLNDYKLLKKDSAQYN
jgi:hypothetical protein